VVNSEIYPGNVSEPATFEQMVSQFINDKNIILIMDRGIATAANIALAYKLGIKYIAANRELRREFDQSRATEFKTRSGSTVYFYKEEVGLEINNEKVREVRLFCLSEGRKFKEEGMNASRKIGYESGLMNLANQIKKGVSPMNESEVYKRIGALNSKYGVSRHYDVKTVNSETETVRGGPLVTDLKFEFKPLPYTKMSDPGVYNIRTNALDLSAQEIFTSYNDLTRIESSFRSFKSELGFRPIYHKKDERIDGHLFITILAYQCVTWIRNQLKSANKNYSWKTIRNKLSSLAISEIKYHTPNGNTVKLQCGVIYEQHKEIFDAVGFIYNKLNTLDFTFLKNI
jgi:transposase